MIVEGDFKMTKAVRERMQKLCGATNYSLGLRSSEHAARYEFLTYQGLRYRGAMGAIAPLDF